MGDAQPDGLQPLIDMLTQAAIEYLDRQIKAGAEAVQLFERWAEFLPEPFFQRWCIQAVAKVIGALKKWHPAIPNHCLSWSSRTSPQWLCPLNPS